MARGLGSAHADLAAALARAEAAAPTYAPPGISWRDDRPAGSTRLTEWIDLGRGPEVYGRAVAGLQAWRAHEVPGIGVFPPDQPIEPGATVLVVLGRPPLGVVAPCRIVQVIAEEDRWGFAYGTLPGHPEQGEEAFLVQRRADGSVRFEIRAVSRPAHWWVRAGGPLNRVAQRVVTAGYLRSLRRAVDHSPS
jgi:uncharacterized protein (UPF0548 family)